MNKIEKEDEYDFRRYFYQNYLPSNILKSYYDGINEKQPLTEYLSV